MVNDVEFLQEIYRSSPPPHHCFVSKFPNIELCKLHWYNEGMLVMRSRMTAKNIISLIVLLFEQSLDRLVSFKVIGLFDYIE